VVSTGTLPKLTEAGLTLNWPEAATAVPVPENDSGICELVALLAKEREPDTAPLLFGVKATLNDRLCPGAIVKGNVAPLKTNCELLVLSEVTVTGDPEALIVIAWVCVLPTATLPKFNAFGLTVNWLDGITGTPVPVKGTFN
jgi:hypothetical protein